MTTSHRGEVEGALAAWREAERALELTPEDDATAEELRTEVWRLRAEYQRAVLASRGRIDQLEETAEDSWDTLHASVDLTDHASHALRRD